MKYYPGFKISYDLLKKNFIYSDEVFVSGIEERKLDDIRKSLKDSNCSGPAIVYVIAMDIGRKIDKEDLIKKNLLYGVCIYSKGKLGDEPVRSQGHIHSISNSCNSSTPEVYEIWEGEAIIYMQESVKNDPGKIYAIKAKEGEKVIVPPGWAHYTINANSEKNMIFGAWCIRDFGFDYNDVRKHGGLAYFPIFTEKDLKFIPNKTYKLKELIIKGPREYKEFNLDKDKPIYEQYLENRDKFRFVTNPNEYSEIWGNFIP
ncbi:glucose-6-phosphate isomerase family protein [Fusobacterium sp.]|uniref:glucose-6-phosphate isomerase family protein n=1 Tax=Fusobacterium sp. TaxID=68766 RepID=UPI0025B977CC|nr:glucose-6-phosphate isomerase family protein [Fusobacterium sp.]